jgi:hypothetical protein
MANPYPMQPMQQPMMPPPMAGGAPRPMVRQGTSKAVPVVVSAGLAIGVFCGLLFGLGVDKDEARASTKTDAPVTSNAKKAETDVAAPFQPERKDPKVPSMAPQVVPDKDAKAGSGSAGSGSGAGSGSAVTVPAKPQKIIGKLIVEVVPDEAAKIAKLTVDGTEVEGLSWELDMTELAKGKKIEDVKKEVKVVVKASGYRDSAPQKVELVAEQDAKPKVTLQKRSTGGGTGNLPRVQQPVVPNNGGNRPPPNTGGNKPPPPKCRKPPCGLIDI